MLRSTRQIEDLVGYAQNQGTKLIIYTNAKVHGSGNIPTWIKAGRLEIRPLP